MAFPDFSSGSSPVALSGQDALKGPDPAYIDIFPYSSNVRLGSEGALETHLSVLSTMAIDAAIQVQLQHPNAKLVIPGETPFEDMPNTTDLMAQRAVDAGVNKSKVVPLYRLHDGRPLNNTYLQARGLGQFHAGDAGGVLVMTIDNHAPRVRSALKKYDATPDFFTSVEAVLEALDNHEYDQYLPVIDWLKRTELISRLMTDWIGMPGGRIPNFMTARRGPRVVDVVDNGGNLVIENDFAWRKRARLEAEAASAMSLRAA